jgi:formate-dependent phosphoribosylglycinamide formyltransferase (GAR transformylase)
MKILLFAATTGYQVRAFGDAAKRMGAELVLATDRCHVLDNPWGDDAVPMQFEDAVSARGPFDGIVAVGDQPALAAAQAAERMGLRFHPSEAVRAAKNKHLSRERFKAAGLLTPEYHLDAGAVRYPCVLKPVGLSASRGVIRANNDEEFAAAYARIQKMLEHETEKSIQVEDFIPGREFAVEGLVTSGVSRVLALFDKPDPLDGPFFEETIYVTPSRESDAIQRAIRETTQRAVTALGLSDGPIHAEMRVNDRGVWMLEIAARPIGGLCSRVLQFDSGASLEEVILRHAIGEDVSRLKLASGASGVMMIPIPRAGIYAGADGIERARCVEGIEDVLITAKEGQMLLPLPEGGSYLGFIFARADTPESVDRALRESHAKLEFRFATALPVVR